MIEQDTDDENNESGISAGPRKRLFSGKMFALLVLIGFIVPIAYGGWRDLYKNFLETTPPEIAFRENPPRGIGLTPVTIRLGFNDLGAGLDEVVIRIKQRGRSRELVRRSLEGKPSGAEDLYFPGQQSELEEGVATLEVRAFDRSIWNNTAEYTYNFNVDFRKPKIEVLSTQHNARKGGSQIVFYKAYDESLAVSGVKVGSATFPGYPARGLDKDFEDPNLYIAMYAIDLKLQDTQNLAVKVFAEDQVGNGISMPFYNKIGERSQRSSVVNVTDDFLRDQVSMLFENNLRKLQEISSTLVQKGGGDRLIENFQALNESLRELNDNEISSAILLKPRFESFLTGAFLRQGGTTQISYGDFVSYQFEGNRIGGMQSLFSEISLPRSERDVVAANDGIVVLSDNVGVYGRLIALDHGLGLTSLYGYLSNVVVNKGDIVKRGQAIGVAGKTGFGRGNSFMYQLRVQGVPVDPVEWWDSSWFHQHITQKANQVKRDLGMPVYIPLQ